MSTENETPAPETVGLPSGLNPKAVLARKSALIAAGTEPLLAEHLAIQAERGQVHRDSLEEKIQSEAKQRTKEAKK